MRITLTGLNAYKVCAHELMIFAHVLWHWQAGASCWWNIFFWGGGVGTTPLSLVLKKTFLHQQFLLRTTWIDHDLGFIT